MPELPEVETIVRTLRQVLPGRTFGCVAVGWRPMVQKSPLDLVEMLPGQRIERIDRRGKYLVFYLSTGNALLIHLKMSGRLYVCAAADAPDPYDRITFFLDDDRQLRFRDPRKFGRAHLTADASSVLDRLGPEPLDKRFGQDEFLSRFTGRRGVVKLLLVDQTFIAGVGNIYADEALFRAHIQPSRRTATLSDTEKRGLYGAVRYVLNASIALNGSTLADGMYHGGNFQNTFCVYGREKEPCPVCGAEIERIKLGQRSAYFCPSCQS
jgi:formamidopyrimidine-DNA glycosylase